MRTKEDVEALPAQNIIVSDTGADNVVSTKAVDLVVALQTSNDIGPVCANNDVISGRAGDRHGHTVTQSHFGLGARNARAEHGNCSQHYRCHQCAY